jgi:hypothetical protein
MAQFALGGGALLNILENEKLREVEVSPRIPAGAEPML